jgi:hypothetical protein
VFGRYRVETSSRKLAILTDDFHYFPQSLQTNTAIFGLPSIRPRSPPSKSFEIHHSLITLSFHTIYKLKLSHLHAMKALGGEEYSSYSFLASTLDGGKWSASRLGPALPRGKDPRYPLYRRLGGPQTGLDTEARGKILCLCRGSNNGRPVVHSTLFSLIY